MAYPVETAPSTASRLPARHAWRSRP